jgi:hypothetical protein
MTNEHCGPSGGAPKKGNYEFTFFGKQSENLKALSAPHRASRLSAARYIGSRMFRSGHSHERFDCLRAQCISTLLVPIIVCFVVHCVPLMLFSIIVF